MHPRGKVRWRTEAVHVGGDSKSSLDAKGSLSQRSLRSTSVGWSSSGEETIVSRSCFRCLLFWAGRLPKPLHAFAGRASSPHAILAVAAHLSMRDFSSRCGWFLPGGTGDRQHGPCCSSDRNRVLEQGRPWLPLVGLRVDLQAFWSQAGGRECG